MLLQIHYWGRIVEKDESSLVNILFKNKFDQTVNNFEAIIKKITIIIHLHFSF